MEFADYLDTLRREGTLLAEAAASAGPEQPVPTCPDWSVAHLLLHIGTTHRWAAANASGGGARVPLSQVRQETGEPDPHRLLPWYREGHARLVQALETTPRDAEAWTFTPAADPLLFWARRQAHETTIHRVDACAAGAAPAPPVPARAAADGVDEFLGVLLPRLQVRRGDRPLTDRPRAMDLHAADTGDTWHVEITPAEVTVDRGGAPGELVPGRCLLQGSAEALYLLLWNRGGASAVVTDPDGTLDWWRREVRI